MIDHRPGPIEDGCPEMGEFDHRSQVMKRSSIIR
jgi:hypothetical protein